MYNPTKAPKIIANTIETGSLVSMLLRKLGRTQHRKITRSGSIQLFIQGHGNLIERDVTIGT
ncbi:MAG: hypothetical protein PUB94_06320 [Oscillospiraceae bacterium]|nr:hypothetical protein [Oscillospiraceae bacterium]